MKQDHWDEIIREKMQSFRVEETPKDWEIFEEKLGLSQGEPALHPVEDFDQMVFKKLNHFEANSDNKEQHWQLFEKQMYYLSHLRQRLLQYKFLEVVALALLLLYVVEADAPGTTPLSAPIANNDIPPIERITTDAPVRVSSESDLILKDMPSVTSALSDGQSSLLDWMPDLPRESRHQSNDISGLPPLVSAVPELTSLSSAAPALPIVDNNTAFAKDWIAVTTLPSASASLAQQSPRLITNVKPAKQLSVYISMLGGYDYNRVMTPENLPAGIKAFERYASGYRGGLMADLGRSNGRLRLGGGLIYTAKKYEVGYKRINGSFLRRGGLTTESLSDIEINILNVPVFARWEVIQGDKWSLFAHGGLALQMALQTNYYAAYPDNFPQPLGINRTPSRFSPLSDRNGGLLEGGNLKENGFFSSQFGLGAERQMADRWSMFFQSRYEHSIGYLSSGLGPTQDRMNTFSLETGVRVRLK